jgi:S-DNA-T family DNA segregation ATPase FtsK/SpoIIIE
MATALEGLVAQMRARIDVLRGHTRNHEPSLDEPAVLILIDELAALTAYVEDKKLKERIKNALSILLSQGRAAQFHVVAALQDPRKEVLPFRNLFATRIALRLNEESEVALVLHDDSIDRGAECHLIPVDQPGVAYVVAQGTASPLRIRFPYLSDEQIAELADTYRPGGGWVVNR